jgi:hypothetical protein
MFIRGITQRIVDFADLERGDATGLLGKISHS